MKNSLFFRISFFIILLAVFYIVYKNVRNDSLVNHYQSNYAAAISKEKNLFKSQILSGVVDNTTKSIGLIDTVLLVIDEFEAPFLRFYSLSDFSVLGVFGEKGQGPGKFRNPKYDNQFYYENGKLYFYISDAQNFTLTKLDLEKVLRDKRYRASSYKHLPPPLILSYVSLFYTKDGSMIGNYRGNGDERSGKGGRFFSYTERTRTMKWIKYFPKRKQYFALDKIPYYYYSYCAYNTSKQILASAMNRFSQVDFISLPDKQCLSEIAAFDNSHVEFSILPEVQSPNSDIYYFSAFGGEKYFYSLYFGTKLKNTSDSLRLSELHIFEWSGKLKKRLLLDKSRMGTFVVDEKRQFLYALNYRNSAGAKELIKYDFSTLTDY